LALATYDFVAQREKRTKDRPHLLCDSGVLLCSSQDWIHHFRQRAYGNLHVGI
jgi:hypothetical protein